MELGNLFQTTFGKAFSESNWYQKTSNFSFDNLAQSANRFFNADNFNTQLTSSEQTKFNSWVSEMKSTPSPSGNGETVINKNDTFHDYDMQGYWKDNVMNNPDWKPNSENGHFVDTYKKPNHVTFSTGSKYATGAYKQLAGTWKGEGAKAIYIPSKTTLKAVNKK